MAVATGLIFCDVSHMKWKSWYAFQLVRNVSFCRAIYSCVKYRNFFTPGYHGNVSLFSKAMVAGVF